MGIRVNTGTVGKKAATELLSGKRDEALAYHVLAATSGESTNSAGMALTSEELQKFLGIVDESAQAPASNQADLPVAAVPTPIAGEFRVNTFTTGNQLQSQVTALDGGGFVVTWASNGQDGSLNGIYGQRYTAAGVADGGEFRINTTTADTQYRASATALNGGGFVVTWESNLQDGSGFGIYAQRYTAAGVADGGEFRVNTATTFDQLLSSVATLNSGGFVVTWSSIQDGANYNIYGQRYTAAGVADGSEFIVNTFTTDQQLRADVAALNNGGFVVTWDSNLQDGSGLGVYGQRYTAAGVADGSEFRVNTFTTGNQTFCTVAGFDGGGFVVTWTSAAQDGSSNGIYGQRYLASGLVNGSEFRVNTFTTNSQTQSSVTALNDGGFLVTWSSTLQDGDSVGVYGQRFDAAGAADGAEFLINETTTVIQFQDSFPLNGVTQLSDGSIVATWRGNGIGDDVGVFARQFSLGASNAAPAGTDATLTITEDTARVLAVADFGFTDTDGNALLSVGITTLPSAGTITLNGSTVTAGTFVTAADINAGLLVYTPGSNGNGTGYSSFTFQVRDDGGSTDTDLSANTITFDVTAVNDAPVNTVPSARTETSGSTIVFSTANGNALTISDVDAGAGIVRVKVATDHGTLTLVPTVGLMVIGNGSGIIKITGTLADINTALNGLTLQGEAGYTGIATLVLTHNDLGTGGSGQLIDKDRVTITWEAQAQEPLGKLDANNADGDIATAFAPANNGGYGDDSLAGLFHPSDLGRDLILGLVYVV